MLSSGLLALEKAMGEMANDFRNMALEIDRNPHEIYNKLDVDGINVLANLLIPEKYNDNPLVLDGQKFYGVSVLERVIALEKLSYGDVGVVLASPGPSLSGQVVLDMGNEIQQEYYFNRFNRQKTWTFFALTEPNRGSDASNIESSMVRQSNDLILNGEKKFIGNGKRAQIGLVFTRTNKGPLGIRSVLVDPRNEGFFAEKLETLGLKGAELSHLIFKDVHIDSTNVLGEHLSPTRRGLWGAIQTFNKMRPGVAALALGVAQATMDYIVEQKKVFNAIDQHNLSKLKEELLSVRNMVRYAACEVDQDATKGYTASMAKVKAIELVEKITEYAVYILGPNSLIEHPHLNKWYRDAKAFEFMEGTTNIQNINISQSYLSGRMTHV